MEKKLSSEVIEQIKEKRRSQLLHGEVEAKLIAMLARVILQYYPIKEPQGLAGGRNDLMLFEFSGRKILFEVLATASQVSRDLRILDKTKADVKIDVIIDPEIDNRVIEKFLKENPENNYPYIFIGELFEQSLMHRATFKMLELITGNEEAKFNRMLRQRVSTNFLEMCKKEGLQILSSKDLESGSITFQKLFLTVIAKRLMDLGANQEQLKDLLRWMSDEEMLKFILMKINLGFNMFLYTDLNETKAIYSDNELMDWIRVSYQLPEARILLSLNCVVYYVIDNRHYRK
jgi:hypothetical protein